MPSLEWEKANKQSAVRSGDHAITRLSPDDVRAVVPKPDLMKCACGAERRIFVTRSAWNDHRDLCPSNQPQPGDHLLEAEELLEMRDTDEYTRLAIMQGFEVEKLGSGHLRFISPGGDVATIPSTGATRGKSSATTRARLEKIGMRFDKGEIRRARKAERRERVSSQVSSSVSSSNGQNGQNDRTPATPQNPPRMGTGSPGSTSTGSDLDSTPSATPNEANRNRRVVCPDPKCKQTPTLNNLSNHMKLNHPRWKCALRGHRGRTSLWLSPSAYKVWVAMGSPDTRPTTYNFPDEPVVARETHQEWLDHGGAASSIAATTPKPIPDTHAPRYDRLPPTVFVPAPPFPIATNPERTVESLLRRATEAVWPDGVPLDSDAMMLAAVWIADTRKFLEELVKLEGS